MHGPVYATTGDLAEYLDTEAPANADRLLARASRVVDSLLIGARYATDEQDQPTDPTVVDALLDATVIQAAYWHHNGEPDQGSARYSSVSIGSVRLQGGGAAAAGSVDGVEVAPGVVTVLQVPGLLPVSPARAG